MKENLWYASAQAEFNKAKIRAHSKQNSGH